MAASLFRFIGKHSLGTCTRVEMICYKCRPEDSTECAGALHNNKVRVQTQITSFKNMLTHRQRNKS